MVKIKDTDVIVLKMTNEQRQSIIAMLESTQVFGRDAANVGKLIRRMKRTYDV